MISISVDINLSGKLVTVTGWGRDENRRLSPILMEHTAAVLSTRECDRRWDREIFDKMLCMDTQDGDSCAVSVLGWVLGILCVWGL